MEAVEKKSLMLIFANFINIVVIVVFIVLLGLNCYSGYKANKALTAIENAVYTQEGYSIIEGSRASKSVHDARQVK